VPSHQAKIPGVMPERRVCSHCRALGPAFAGRAEGCTSSGAKLDREREKFITRQPPIGETDDDDSENFWISEGLFSSSRRRRKGEDRGEGGGGREKVSASEVDVGVEIDKNKIKVERRRGHDFFLIWECLFFVYLSKRSKTFKNTKDT